ncbi:Cullin family-domain-containing protein [Phycomyces nitens]|nr:Cullin family-domain-containing protein [Phycomyces nitens]
MDWPQQPMKRPRLDNPLTINNELCDEVMSEPQTPSLPFSTFLSNSLHRTQRLPILSDEKLIVYDLKVERPVLPVGYEENAWKRLKKAIHAIQQNVGLEESLEVLYQLAENLCQYDLAESLYGRLRHECKVYLETEFESISRNESQGVEFLEIVNKLWKNHCDQIPQLRCIFLNMDRIYLNSMTKSESIWNMGIELFSACYLKHPNIREKLIHNLLSQIQEERDQHPINTTLLQSNLRMLIDLSLYHSEFEGRLLEETRSYYKAEGDRLMESMSMSDYLIHVSTRAHQESAIRLKKYFDKSSKSALTKIVEEELLSSRVNTILDKSFNHFMGAYKVDDLSMVYRLFAKVNKLDVCVKYFINYIKRKGSSILRDHAGGKDPIPALANFKRKTDTVVEHSFEEDTLFVNGMKDGVDYFVNLRQNNATELLARHTDYALRNSKVDEKALDQTIVFFRVLQSKDIFEVLYKRDLAKRLLLDVMNRNAEKLMLAKMKKEYGNAYTSKMEGMLQDIKTSNELMNEFRTKTGYDESQELEFRANILTSGFWPSYTPVEINLPSQVNSMPRIYNVVIVTFLNIYIYDPCQFTHIQKLYQDFYCTKDDRRRLTWQNSLSVCEVWANYPLGAKEITLTLLQTVVLLLFNNVNKSVSFSDILVETKLDELELRRTLKSLACGPHKLLVKTPKGPDVEPTDEFTFNTCFEAEQTKFQMNTDTLNEVIEKDTSLQQTVFNREMQIDAAIVRIMKAKHTLRHSELMSEVPRHVRFMVTATDVKKRVELLMEKEFLVRTEDDGYEYLS